MTKDKKRPRQPIVVPLDRDMHESLRRIAYLTHSSMNDLVRSAIEKLIQKYEKKI